jgi:hypothetical protein
MVGVILPALSFFHGRYPVTELATGRRSLPGCTGVPGM